MYNISKLNSIYGIVGWEQPFSSSVPTLNDDNLGTASGIYVNRMCPIAKLTYLMATMEGDQITATELNAKLQAIQEESIIEVVQDIWQSEDILEYGSLYTDNPDEFYERPNNGDFVGYELILDKRKDLLTTINSVWTYFSGSGTIQLRLFNQFTNAPLKTEELTITDKTLQKHSLDWQIPFHDTLLGGRYYIGYLNGGITPLSLDGSRCANRFEYIRMCEGSVRNKSDLTIWDYDQWTGYGYDHGLNFDITVEKDVSKIVIDNKKSFAPAIALKIAIKIIQEYITTNESSHLERMSNEAYSKIKMELEGRPQQGISGIIPQYKNEIKKLKRNYTNDGYNFNVASRT